MTVRGKPPPTRAILLALWLYATLRGVGSARELNRLCHTTRPIAGFAAACR